MVFVAVSSVLAYQLWTHQWTTQTDIVSTKFLFYTDLACTVPFNDAVKPAIFGEGAAMSFFSQDIYAKYNGTESLPINMSFALTGKQAFITYNLLVYLDPQGSTYTTLSEGSKVSIALNPTNVTKLVLYELYDGSLGHIGAYPLTVTIVIQKDKIDAGI